MAFNLFNKKAAVKSKAKPLAKVADGPVVQKETHTPSVNYVLKRVYVSEKASQLQNFSQYMFEVERTANKQEIKKSVEARYKVNVERVHVLNMPAKRRTVGRHVGQRAGFPKARGFPKKRQTN